MYETKYISVSDLKTDMIGKWTYTHLSKQNKWSRKSSKAYMQYMRRKKTRRKYYRISSTFIELHIVCTAGCKTTAVIFYDVNIVFFSFEQSKYGLFFSSNLKQTENLKMQTRRQMYYCSYIIIICVMMRIEKRKNIFFFFLVSSQYFFPLKKFFIFFPFKKSFVHMGNLDANSMY